MSDLPHPTPPSGSRFKGHTLRLVAALLVGLLILLIGGILGMALTTVAIMAAAGAVVFWLAWLVILRGYIHLSRRTS